MVCINVLLIYGDRYGILTLNPTHDRVAPLAENWATIRKVAGSILNGTRHVCQLDCCGYKIHRVISQISLFAYAEWILIKCQANPWLLPNFIPLNSAHFFLRSSGLGIATPGKVKNNPGYGENRH